MPILSARGKPIGVASAGTLKKVGFNVEEKALFELVARQAAPALVTAGLHQQMQRAQEEERMLLEMTTTISRELQLDELLAQIVHSVSTFLNADRSTLFMHDKKTNELTAILGGNATSFYGFDADKLAPLVERIGPKKSLFQK